MQKYILLIGVIGLLLSCKSQEKKSDEQSVTIGGKSTELSASELGKKLFNGKGKCYTCHKLDKKSIGPSVQAMMKIYNEQNGDIVAFLKQEADPIVDPETYTVMKTNFALLKTFSDKELEALEAYMYSVVE
ncbi:c-type cytochrome [Aquimarina brevivitae]|uniref:Cytochrome c n=1 Tax=Aquimarina brevivitae TaxID=323412 RepID=A0A4Q7PF98_9FLAO|nr:c-type cytochrome [Aquimarina brevivitae]RZS99136.1 cytochrome c [Aquimarina brevivitae]